MPHSTRREFLTVSGTVLGGIAVGTTVTAATRTDRFIVSTKGRADLSGLDVVHEMQGVDYAVVEGAEKDVRRAVKDYAPDIEIEFDLPAAQPQAAETQPSPTNEPLYPLQWDKQVLDVPSAHEVTQGEGTRIAVIDTGIPESHPDFQETLNADLSRDFTGTGTHEPLGLQYHGTHVGGIASAEDNEQGIVGVAPESEVVDLRVFEKLNSGASFADILAAIVYSVNIGCDVANLSLGAYPIPRQGQGEFYGKVLNSTMTFANKEGTLLVIAAGNDGANLQQDKNLISLPNEGAQAVSVASTTSIGYLSGDVQNPGFAPASYTNYGTNAVTVAAPGGDTPQAGGVPDLVYSAIPQTTADFFFGEGEPPYAYLAGTSMAAPQVAGAAALVKSANPNYNANQVEAALKKAAEVPEGYDKAFYGSGFLNIVDAL
ncbi:S8 family serine peptidase [Halovenus halobia]|uniref:S8 family serine peptidase n=1 Tax=Halovenus halobia TaxID=3396622 RepID=UPI003F5526CB